jgi:hypothetical protein
MWEPLESSTTAPSVVNACFVFWLCKTQGVTDGQWPPIVIDPTTKLATAESVVAWVLDRMWRRTPAAPPHLMHKVIGALAMLQGVGNGVRGGEDAARVTAAAASVPSAMTRRRDNDNACDDMRCRSDVAAPLQAVREEADDDGDTRGSDQHVKLASPATGARQQPSNAATTQTKKRARDRDAAAEETIDADVMQKARALARSSKCTQYLPCGRLPWKACEELLGAVRAGKEPLTTATIDWIKHVCVAHSKTPRATLPTDVSVAKNKIMVDGCPLLATSLCKGGISARAAHAM